MLRDALSFSKKFADAFGKDRERPSIADTFTTRADPGRRLELTVER
jgi:hypothetical protein